MSVVREWFSTGRTGKARKESLKGKRSDGVTFDDGKEETEKLEIV